MTVAGPELSRRVAAALAEADVSFADRAIIAQVVHRTSSVAELPDWLLRLLARHGLSV